MSWLSKVGKAVSRPSVAGVVGASLALATTHPFGAVRDNFMDAAMYDPYLEEAGIRGRDIDNYMLGYDITPGEMFPNPITPILNHFRPSTWNIGGMPSARDLKRAFSTETFRNTKNFESGREKERDLSMNAFERQSGLVDSFGAGDDPYWTEKFGMPYRPSVIKDQTYANGNMVFGMYNTRMR